MKSYYNKEGKLVPYEIWGEIHFKSEIAAWIFENYCLGQLSDGYFEDQRFDWEFWYHLKIIVDGKKGWIADRVPLNRSFDWSFSRENDSLYNKIIEVYPLYREDFLDDDLEEVYESMINSLKRITFENS